jgi:hypothetical protein
MAGGAAAHAQARLIPTQMPDAATLRNRIAQLNSELQHTLYLYRKNDPQIRTIDAQLWKARQELKRLEAVSRPPMWPERKPQPPSYRLLKRHGA